MDDFKRKLAKNTYFVSKELIIQEFTKKLTSLTDLLSANDLKNFLGISDKIELKTRQEQLNKFGIFLEIYNLNIEKPSAIIRIILRDIINLHFEVHGAGFNRKNIKNKYIYIKGWLICLMILKSYDKTVKITTQCKNDNINAKKFVEKTGFVKKNLECQYVKYQLQDKLFESTLIKYKIGEMRDSEIIKKIQTSPIFNISLSSKELFHSNFIAWLAQNYPIQIGKMFSDILGVTNIDDIVDTATIKREEKKIDLQFKLVSGKHIIIENKVKSLPYKKQLEKYSIKYINDRNANFILLSLSRPDHLIEEEESLAIILNEKKYIWHYMSYLKLASFLQQEIINNGAFISEYHRFIITDYIEFVNNLVLLEKLIRIEPEENYNIYNNSLFQNLNKIRLGDYYIKKIYENLSLNLYNKIKSLINNRTSININNDLSEHNEGININSSIVSGNNGEVRLYYKINNRITLSIELSNLYYRKMVHIRNADKSKKVFHKKYNSENIATILDRAPYSWFSFNNIKKQAKYKSRKNGGFNKFGSTTRYKQCKVSVDNTFQDIISYFIYDFKLILSIKDELNMQFSDTEITNETT